LEVTSDLALAYYYTQQHAQAEPLLEDSLKLMQPRESANALDVAFQLNLLGECQVMLRKYGDAEARLRSSLTIYQGKSPQGEMRFDTESLLGAALAGQKKFAEAEPLALSGHKGLEGLNPPGSKNLLKAAHDRVIALYDGWGKKEEAAKWRAKKTA